MSQQSGLPDSEVLSKSLLEIAVESWRFGRTIDRVLSKLDKGEQERYGRQLHWFRKKVEESLGDAGLRITNIEGQRFDPGIAATPINLAEFDNEDSLVVDQMLEPIIMGPDGLARAGTVTLRREEP